MNIDYKLLMLSIIFIVATSYIILNYLTKVLMMRNKKMQKIVEKGNRKSKKDPNEKTIVKLINLVSIVTSRFDNKEAIRLKLIRAGYPFKRLGINEKNYTSFKILFVLVSMVTRSNVKTSIIQTLSTGALSYALIEWYVHRKMKKRHKEIELELDNLISTTVDGLSQGLNIMELFTLLPERISINNPLCEELTRVKLKLTINKVSTNTEAILNELQNRIYMTEIDNYCLALKQHEVAGKAIRMLRKQLELIRSQESLSQKRETQYKTNLNSISVIVFVACTMIIIVGPMIIVALQNPIFK